MGTWFEVTERENVKQNKTPCEDLSTSKSKTINQADQIQW